MFRLAFWTEQETVIQLACVPSEAQPSPGGFTLWTWLPHGLKGKPCPVRTVEAQKQSCVRAFQMASLFPDTAVLKVSVFSQSSEDHEGVFVTRFTAPSCAHPPWVPTRVSAKLWGSHLGLPQCGCSPYVS